MDIAALSMGMCQSTLQQNSSLAVMKIAMDSAKSQGNMMVNQLLSPPTNAMEQSVQPHIGGNIDFRV